MFNRIIHPILCIEISPLPGIEQSEFRELGETQAQVAQCGRRLPVLSEAIQQVPAAEDQRLQVHQYGVELANQTHPEDRQATECKREQR